LKEQLGRPASPTH